MSETNLRRRVVDILRGEGYHVTPHEDLVSRGVADLSYGGVPGEKDGWLELKFRREWPKRGKTLVKFDHFTRQQVWWLMDRDGGSTNVGILIQIAQEYLYLRPEHAPQLYRGMVQEELRRCATVDESLKRLLLQWVTAQGSSLLL